MTGRFVHGGLIVAALAVAACGNNTDATGVTAGAGGAESGNRGVGGGGAGSGTSGGTTSGGSSTSGGATSGSGGAVVQGGTSGNNASGAGGMSVSTSGAGGTAGTSNQSGGAAGMGSTPQVLTPTINAFCAAARACCAKAGEPEMLDDCESQFATHHSTVASVVSGAITVDPVALAACLAAYQQAATTCEENPVVSACQNVYVGARAANEPCSNGQECKRDQGPATCLITAINGTSGTCKPIPHGKSGDACVYTCGIGEDCSSTTYGDADSTLTLCFEQEGLYCDNSDGSVCKPLLALGAPCTGFDECGTANYCDTTCKHAGTLGQACDTSECLESLECIDGKCQSPPFSVGSVCMGYSLGP